MSKPYFLVAPDLTTGWDPLNDPNQKNSYGMYPAEVAIQAGCIKELLEIGLHPSFELASLGRTQLYMNSGLGTRVNPEDYPYKAVEAALAHIRQRFDPEAMFQLPPKRAATPNAPAPIETPSLPDAEEVTMPTPETTVQMPDKPHVRLKPTLSVVA